MGDNNYYVYFYLREDGTPYYVGKGKGWRAYDTWRRVAVPPRDRIVKVLENLTNEQACRNEIDFINFYGRKDLGTGILRNMTDGGEGAPGILRSKETREKISKALKGRKLPDWRIEQCRVASLGKKWSEEHTEKFKRTMQERYGGAHNKGKSPSVETLEKVRFALKGKKQKPEHIEKRKQSNTGKKRSVEFSLRMSERQKGIPKGPRSEKSAVLRTVTCPHCGITGDAGPIKRWHFDNCKTLNATGNTLGKFLVATEGS